MNIMLIHIIILLLVLILLFTSPINLNYTYTNKRYFIECGVQFIPDKMKEHFLFFRMFSILNNS